MDLEWPEGKKFAFTVFDDTDGDYVENTKPVYDLLNRLGMKTTKSVWVYPPRDSYSGLSLANQKYESYIRELQESGFEIALHNVGSGDFSRSEIRDGIEAYHDVVGEYPTSHTNHASNSDSLYWFSERFVPPFSSLYKAYKWLKGGRIRSNGHQEKSNQFWGDIAAEHIEFVRNYTFNGVNTLKYDPKMPWHDPSKPHVPYWFSSSDGHTVEEFTDLISPENIEQLEKEGGLCIVYTHFGSGFCEDGEVDDEFQNRIQNLAEKDGWFVPVSEVLEWLVENRPKQETVPYRYLLRLNCLWALDRVRKIRKHGR